MKRVLIIAHAYPPCPEVGSLRPAGLAKYLPDYGWQPTVLTVRLPGKRPSWAPVIETDYEDVLQTWKMRFGLEGSRSLHDQLKLPMAQKRDSELMHTRILSLLRYVITFPDAVKGWRPFAREALRELKTKTTKTNTDKIDVILSTSPPITTHLIAREAKRMFGCPWVADFRDLWSQNLAQGYDLLRLFEGPVERRTLRDADALVSVSEPWADNLRRRYPTKSVFSITNGFDPDDFPPGSDRFTERFTITYTGRLYQGKRDPTPLFSALRDLMSEGAIRRDTVRVRFYGPIEPWLTPLVRSYGLEDVVEIAGSVSREEALQRQQESQLLLLLCWSDPRETGQHTGKVFEYLGSRRPILAIGGARGVISDLLEETQTGTHRLASEQVKNALRAWYEEFSQTGRVIYRGDQKAIDAYSHEEMASRFADVLEGAVNRAAPALPNRRRVALADGLNQPTPESSELRRSNAVVWPRRDPAEEVAVVS